MNTFTKHHLSYHKLTINPHDAAPLLGYESALPDDILSIVQQVMEETADCFDICGGYQIFNQITFVSEGHHIHISSNNKTPNPNGEALNAVKPEVVFFPQKTVYHQLKRSEQIAVFVCTAGEGISQWSKAMMSSDPLKGFIADILGSVVVDAAVESLQQKIRDEMQQSGLKITNRYSPGYCGWSTDEQQKLFSLLPQENCGIQLTESSLMLPIKSISGFIGIGANVRYNPYTCQMCDAAYCVYRNRVR